MTSRLQSSGIAALSFSLSACVLALALTPSVASAAPGQEIELTAPTRAIVETKRVDISDLDLTDASDLKVLNRRIDRAVTQVCRDPGMNPATDSGNCAFNARRGADEQVAALLSSARVASAANVATASRSIATVASR